MLTTTNPKGETIAYTYNSNGYLIAVDGPLPGTNDTVSAAYDAYGRMQNKTDADGYTVTFAYDDLDRTTNITFPDGTFDQITYQRLQPSIIQDRAGRQTILEHDALGNLTRRTDPLGRVTRFQWCDCGSIKSLTDPMGRTTEWQMDVQGRLAAKQYGDGSKVTYLYESASGRLRQVVDEKLQVKQFTYNRDDTLRSISYLNTAVPTPTVTYAYDSDFKRRQSMSDGLGTTLYTYLPITGVPTVGAGRLASVDGPYANDTITYSYDQLGRMTNVAINGVTHSLTYDAAGRLVQEANTLGTFAYAYDGNSGRVLAEQFPNGLTVSNAFGNALQDFRLQQKANEVGAVAVSKFTYGYNPPESLITSWSQQVATAAPDLHSLIYDDADRLLANSVTNSGVQVDVFAYAYDAADNRWQEVAGTTTNRATFNALNQLGTSTATSASRTNEWDGQDRLAAVNIGSTRIECTYDGESRLAGLRVLTNGVESSYRRLLWLGSAIREERDAANNVIKRYYPRGMRAETGTNTGNYYYTRDHLGSIRELTDLAGNVRARYAYDPYGRRTQLTGDVAADFGFAGMYWSSEAGLSLTHFRAYSPDLGRWLSRDPLHDAEQSEGPNLYAYVGNNPINAVDTLGLCCEKELSDLNNLRSAGFTPGLGPQCDNLKMQLFAITGGESCGVNRIVATGRLGECLTLTTLLHDLCERPAENKWLECLRRPCTKNSCL